MAKPTRPSPALHLDVSLTPRPDGSVLVRFVHPWWWRDTYPSRAWLPAGTVGCTFHLLIRPGAGIVSGYLLADTDRGHQLCSYGRTELIRAGGGTALSHWKGFTIEGRSVSPSGPGVTILIGSMDDGPPTAACEGTRCSFPVVRPVTGRPPDWVC